MKRLIVCLILLYVAFDSGAQAANVWLMFDATQTPVKRLKNGYYTNPMASYAATMGDTLTYHLSSTIKEVTTIALTIEGPTSILLNDMFGHQLFVRPGDTAHIKVDSLPNNDFYLRPGIVSAWSVTYHYSGSAAATHALFDSLAYVNGVLHLNLFGPKATGFDLDKYLDSVQSIRAARLNFLEAYGMRNSIDSITMEYARSEINWSYGLMLMAPLRFYQYGITKGSLSKRYVAAIDGFAFIPNWFFNASFVAYNALSDYVRYYATPFNAANAWDAGHLDAQAKYMAANFSPQVQLVLLSQLLKEYLANGIVPTDATMSTFTKADPSHKISPSIFNKREQLLVQKNDFSQVLNAPIIDTAGGQSTLAILAAEKPVLIDCWASWCKPCIDQLPFLRKWETQYADRISFISLSFDADPMKWKNAIRKHDITASSAYLLANHFESNLARYFSMRSIPRYILLKPGGSVLVADGPMPENTTAFGQMLQAAVERR